jgi:hypothetical protein
MAEDYKISEIAKQKAAVAAGLGTEELDPTTALPQDVDEGGQSAALSRISDDAKDYATAISRSAQSGGVYGGDAILRDPKDYDFQLSYNDSENELVRADRQSAVGMLAKGATRLVATTGTKFLSGLGYAVSSVPALISWDMDTMLDNGFSATAMELGEEVKEALPIYKTQKYLDGGILDQMLTLGFWTDDVVDGAAFMLSSLMGGYGINAIGKSLGAYSKLAKTFSSMSRAARTGEGITEVPFKLANAVGKMNQATITAFNSVGEAAFEAKDTKDSILAALQEEVDLGMITQEEANKKAAIAARTGFWTNMAIVAPSNHLNTKMFFRHLDDVRLDKRITAGMVEGKTGMELGKELAEEAVEVTSKQKTKAFAKEALKSMGSEGLWEENMQTALQNYNMDKATGKTEKTLINGLVDNWAENFTTKEGQKAIALGAIIGLIPGGIGGISAAKAEAQNKAAKYIAQGALIDNMTKNRMQDFYKRQTVEDEKGNLVEQNAVVVRDGKPVIDENKLAGLFEKAYDNNTDFTAALKATATGNEYIFDMVKNKVFSKLYFDAVAQGGDVETFKTLIKNFAQQEVEDLQRAGKITEENQEEVQGRIDKTAQEYSEITEELDKIYRSIINNYGGLLDLGKSQEDQFAKHGIIATQFNLAAEQLFLNTLAKDLRQQVREADLIESTQIEGVESLTDVEALNKKTNAKAAKKTLGGVEAALADNRAELKKILDPKLVEKDYKAAKAELEKKSEGRGNADSTTEDTASAVETIKDNVKEGKSVSVELSDRSEVNTFTAEDAAKHGYEIDIERSNIINKEVGGKEASYFYKIDEKDGSIHVIYTDGTEKGNILSERTIYNDELIDKTADKRFRTSFNFLNGKLDSVNIKDLDNGRIETYDKEMLNNILGGNTTQKDLIKIKKAVAISLPGELEYTKSKLTTTSIDTTGFEGELTAPTRSEEEIRADIEQAIVEGNKEIADRLEAKKKEIVERLKNEDPDTETAIPEADINIGYDGGVFFIEVQGIKLRIPYRNDITNSIAYDNDGYPTTVALVDNSGKLRMFRDPIIVNELAYTLELIEAVKTHVFDKIKVASEADAIVVKDPVTGIEYAVYRYNSRYQVYTIPKGKKSKARFIPHSAEAHKRVIKQLNTAIVNATERLLKGQTAQPKLKDYEAETLIDFTRSATAEEALNLPEEGEIKDSPQPEQRQEVGEEEDPGLTPPSEEAIQDMVDKITEQMATEEIIEEELQSENDKADLREKLQGVSDPETLDVNERQDDREKKAEEQYRGNPDPGAAISYVYIEDGKDVVENTDFLKDVINEDISTANILSYIDFENEYWEGKEELRDELKAGNLTKEKINELLTAEDTEFDSLVDTLPLALIYRNKGIETEGSLFLHNSGYPHISIPASVYKGIDYHDPAAVLAAENAYRNSVMEKARLNRRKIAKALLQNYEVKFAVQDKSRGTLNLTDTYKPLSSIISELGTVSLANTTLGVGTDSGAIATGASEDMVTGHYGTRGGIYWLTEDTANGDKALVRVQPNKIAIEHAEIVFEAFKQAAAGGLAAKFKYRNFKGDLTVSEVLDLFVTHGKKRTSVGNQASKQHLINKQLWNTKTGIHYGDGNFIKHDAAPEQKVEFYMWMNANKNYRISRSLLNKKIGKSFSIVNQAYGNLVYDNTKQNYNAFVLESGFLSTNVAVVEGTKSITKNPVVMFGTQTFETTKKETMRSPKQELPKKDKTEPVVEKRGERFDYTNVSGKRQTLVITDSIFYTMGGIVAFPKDSPDYFRALAKYKVLKGEASYAEIDSGQGYILFDDGTVVNAALGSKPNWSKTNPKRKRLEEAVAKLKEKNTVKDEVTKVAEPKEGPVSVPINISKGDVKLSLEIFKMGKLKSFTITTDNAEVLPYSPEFEEVNEALKKALDTSEDVLVFEEDAGGYSDKISSEFKSKIEELFTTKPIVEEAEEEITEEDIFGLDDVDDKPFRSVNYTPENYTQIEIEEAKKWVKTRFKDLSVGVVDDLIEIAKDRHAFGQMAYDGMTLSRLAEVGTEYHEAFHRVSLFLMNKKDREAVYNKARAKYNMPEATDAQIEEELAERFRSFVIAKQAQVPTTFFGKLKEFFSKIWNFIQTVFVGPGSLTEIEIETLFDRIEKGRFKYAEVNPVRAKELRGAKVYFEVQGTTFDHIKTDEQYREVVQYLFHTMAVNSGLIAQTGEDYNLKLSNLEDVKKLSYEGLEESLTKTIEQYRTVALKSAKILNADFTKLDKDLLVAIKEKYAGTQDISDNNLKVAIEMQVRSADRTANILQEVVDKFSAVETDLLDYLESLNIVKVKDSTDLDRGDNIDEETGEATSELSKIDTPSFESSLKDSTTSNVKILMSILPASNERSSETGLYKFEEFGPMWSEILRSSLGVVNMEDMMNVLRNKSGGSLAYQVLLKHLNSDTNLKIQFLNAVKAARLDFVNAYYSPEESNLWFGDTVVQKESNAILREWNANLNADSGLVKVDDKTDKTILSPTKFNNLHEVYKTLAEDVNVEMREKGILLSYKSYIGGALNLLNSIGVSITLEQLDIVFAGIDNNQDQALRHFVNDTLQYVFGDQGTLYAMFNGFASAKKLDIKKALSNESKIRKLAEELAAINPLELGDTTVGAKGKKYYLVTPHTTLTNQLDLYKKDTLGEIEKKQRAIYNRNSIYLDYFKENPKEMQEFQLKTLAAYIHDDGTGHRGEEYQLVTDIEEYLIRMAANHRGYIAPPTPADRKFYQYFKGVPKIDMMFDAEMNFNDEVLNTFLGYLDDEKARVELTKNRVSEAAVNPNLAVDLIENLEYKTAEDGMVVTEADIVISSQGSKGFRRLEPGEKVKGGNGKLLMQGGKFIGNGARFVQFAGYETNTKSDAEYITDVLLARIRDEVRKLNELGIIAETKDGYENVLIPNNIISDNKSRIGVDNDYIVLLNAIADNMINTQIAGIEMTKIFTSDPASFKNADDYIKRITGYTSTGSNLATEIPSGLYENDRLIKSDQYNITTFVSHEVESQLYDKYVKIHTDYYYETGMVKSRGEALFLAKEKLKGLKGVDQTDAQTFITPEMYRALAVKLGEWSDQKEWAYNLLVSDETLEKEDELKAMGLVMQPLKLTYMKTYQEGGQSYSIFDKMSLATLFRRNIKGTQIEELLDRMEAKGKYESMQPIDQVKFKTAQKAGNKDFRNLFKDGTNETEFTDLEAISVYGQDFTNLRKQLVTDPHLTSSIALGTQVKKVAISNVEMESEYDNKFNRNEKIKGKDLVKEVHALISEISDRGIEAFKKDVGLNENFEVLDKESFTKKLQEEARRANLPRYVVESFIIEHGDYYIDFDAIPGAREWVQSRLISMAKKAAIDLNLPGNSFIQMSDIGLREIIVDDKGNKSFKGELKWSDENGYIQARASVNLFKHIIPNYKNKTHEERIRFLDKNPDLVALGYRVPTQGQNSTYAIKVVQWLREETGDVIVLPKEGPAMGGFDYDIDKLYAVRHNYDNKGKRIEYLNDENSTEAERARAYARQELADDIRAIHADAETNEEANFRIQTLIDEWVDNNLKTFAARPMIKQNTEKAIQNRLLDLYFSVWLSDKHKVHTSQPLGFGASKFAKFSRRVQELEGIIDADNVPLRTVSPSYQLDVKAMFKFGSRGIGPNALNNVHHSLGQLVDLGLNTNIGIGNTHEVEVGTKDAPKEIKMTSLSHTRGKDNEFITEWFSALIDAHVDIGADPYIYHLNVNDFTMDTIGLLIRAGVGGMETMRFIVQPILKQMAKSQENKDTYLPGYTPKSIDDTLDQYKEALKVLGGEPKELSTNKEAVRTFFNKYSMEQLEGFIALSNPAKEEDRTKEYYESQLVAYEAFRYLQPFAAKLQEAVLASRVDTKKFGNTLPMIREYESKVDKAVSDSPKWYGIRNFDRLMDETYLSNQTDNSIKMARNIVSSTLLEGTPAATRLFNILVGVTGKTGRVTEGIAKLISNEIYVQTAAEFFTKEYSNKLDRDGYKRLVFGNDSVPNKLKRIQNGHLFEELKNNAVIQLLTPIKQQDAPDMVYVNKPDDKYHKDSIVRAWKDMATNENPAIKKFAEDLLLYSYVTSGFKPGVFSFFDLAPRQMLKDIGYDRFMREFKRNAFEPNFMVDMTDEILQNNWQNKDLVPNIPGGRSEVRKNYDHALLALEYGEAFAGYNADGNPVGKPYITLGKKQNLNLYKYVGYNEANNTLIYVRVPKKGYYNKGYVLRENGLERSIMGSNRPNTGLKIINEGIKDEQIGQLLNKEADGKSLLPEFAGTILQFGRDRLITTTAEDVKYMQSEEAAKVGYVSPLEAVRGITKEDISTIENTVDDVRISADIPNGWYTAPKGNIVFVETVDGITSVEQHGFVTPSFQTIMKRLNECK